MRFVVVSTCLLFTNFGLIACSGESGTPSSSQGGSSSVATTASGGSSTSSVNRGGNSNSQSSNQGGTVATGGTSATSGGSVAAGGTTQVDTTAATGGNRQTGGTSNSATTSKGGNTTSGGASARGGTTAAGGTIAQGGGMPRGGTAGVGGSGSSSAGGTTARGGSASGGMATGGSATGGMATGGTPSGVTVTPVQNGKQGKTTRYWDCCMPSCAWSANAKAGGKSSPAQVCGKDGASAVGENAGNACENGKSGYQCNWGAPWEVSATVSYGYAAFNNGCGKCFQLDFNGSGDNPGAKALKGKSMIVQAINIGGIAADQFDLLIPGGGVGAMNACVQPNSNPMWGSADGGSQYGGFLAKCGDNMSCITDMCTKAFGSNTQLMAGCKWFTGWFGAGNNPGVTYAEVSCPAALTDKSKLR